ncbi:MAG: hypothetical protein HY554_09265 [Elusimicrobia bacterium]|nr:hypothetical protein [Elusimicrobiota bacterium]
MIDLDGAGPSARKRALDPRLLFGAAGAVAGAGLLFLVTVPILPIDDGAAVNGEITLPMPAAAGPATVQPHSPRSQSLLGWLSPGSPSSGPSWLQPRPGRQSIAQAAANGIRSALGMPPGHPLPFGASAKAGGNSPFGKPEALKAGSATAFGRAAGNMGRSPFGGGGGGGAGSSASLAMGARPGAAGPGGGGRVGALNYQPPTNLEALTRRPTGGNLKDAQEDRKGAPQKGGLSPQSGIKAGGSGTVGSDAPAPGFGPGGQLVSAAAGGGTGEGFGGSTGASSGAGGGRDAKGGDNKSVTLPGNPGTDDDPLGLGLPPPATPTPNTGEWMLNLSKCDGTQCFARCDGEKCVAMPSEPGSNRICAFVKHKRLASGGLKYNDYYWLPYTPGQQPYCDKDLGGCAKITFPLSCGWKVAGTGEPKGAQCFPLSPAENDELLTDAAFLASLSTKEPGLSEQARKARLEQYQAHRAMFRQMDWHWHYSDEAKTGRDAEACPD